MIKKLKLDSKYIQKTGDSSSAEKKSKEKIEIPEGLVKERKERLEKRIASAMDKYNKIDKSGDRVGNQEVTLACGKYRLKSNNIRVLHQQEMKSMRSVRILSRGNITTCELMFEPKSHKYLFVKTYRDEYSLDNVQAEATILQETWVLGAQRIYGVCLATRQVVTVYAGVTLNQFVHAHLPFVQTIRLLLQVVRTLQRLIDKGFVHNEVKDSNICLKLTKKGPSATLIIDCFMLREVGSDSDQYPRSDETDLVSQMPWVPPELLLHTHPCSEDSDVYSVSFLIMDALEVYKGIPLNPDLVPLLQWTQAALSPDPRHRPSLKLLIQVLNDVVRWARLQPNLYLAHIKNKIKVSDNDTGSVTPPINEKTFDRIKTAFSEQSSE